MPTSSSKSAKPARSKRTAKAVRRALGIRIALCDLDPTIWRRVVVTDDMTLHAFHEVIQSAMGWTNSHLYQFNFEDGMSYGDPETFDDPPVGQGDAHAIRLADLGLEQGSSFIYEYDFGDGWEHFITVELAGPVEKTESYPRCVAGVRACPPEDCGGSAGYDELLEVLADPSHPEHAEMAAWVPANFDPEAFDLELVSSVLARSRRRGRR